MKYTIIAEIETSPDDLAPWDTRILIMKELFLLANPGHREPRIKAVRSIHILAPGHPHITQMTNRASHEDHV